MALPKLEIGAAVFTNYSAVVYNLHQDRQRGTIQAGKRADLLLLSANPGEDIRNLRARLGMTREQFSKLLGVSPGSIFGWETGRTIPRGRSMVRVLEVRKMGVRKARARVGPAGRPGRPARRRRAGATRSRRKKAA